MARQHKIFPGVVSGYELSPYHGWFSILEPKEATNICSNPSLEVDDTGWTAASPGGVNQPTMARTTDEQRRGAWSLKVTTDGDVAHEYEGAVYTIALTADVVYGISVDFKGHKGEKFRLFVCSSVNGEPASAVSVIDNLVSNGQWQKLSLSHSESATTDRYVCVEKYKDTGGALSDKDFYADGLQIETDEVSTYFDGDSLPYGEDNNYIWMGAAHESHSMRSSAELSSGIVRNLKDYGYNILSFFGLGLHPQNNVILENAMLGGGTYQQGKDQVREYSLVGAMGKKSIADLLRNRAHIQDLLRHAHTLQQPMVVRAEMLNDCGVPFSQPVHLRSIYQGGFEGVVDNLYQERSSLQFQMDRPEILEDGEEGDTVGTYEYSATYSRLARRTPSAGWDDWDNGANNDIHCMKFDQLSGRVYVGGQFTSIGSAPLATNRFAYWDVEEETWGTIFAGAGANGTVHDIAIQSNGDVWICGAFNLIDGAASRGVAWYDVSTSTWYPLPAALPATSRAFSMQFASNGYDLYIAGDWNTADGWVYHIDGLTHASTDLTAGGRATTGCYSLDIDRKGDIYVGGTFTTINAVNANNVAMYNGTVWAPLGDGLEVAAGAVVCNSITFGDDGLLYMAGRFDTANNLDAEGICSYNGEVFSQLGAGVDGDLGLWPRRHKWHAGSMYVTMSGAGCSCPPDRPTALHYATWNGTNWSHTDISPTSWIAVTEFDNSGNQYIGGTFTVAGTSSFVTIDNSGSAKAEPVIVITGDPVTPGWPTGQGTLLWIKNESTNQLILLDLDIQDHETLTIDFRRGKKRITSSIRGDVTGFVLPESDFANFAIAPGENAVSVLVDSVDLTSHIYWQIPHDYIGAAVF